MPTTNRSQPTISLDARVRIPDTVLFQELAGEMVLLNLDTGVYFGLDPIGTRIWQLLKAGRSPAAIPDIIREEYEVETSQLRADLLQFIRELRRHGLVEG